ncbi:MAG TPA: glycine zipper 2TM domain-containing protein [Rhodocyclaceae bacterium]
MTTAHLTHKPPLTPRPIPRLLYPSLIVAAVSVAIFSLLGIAGLTGHFPTLLAKTDSAQQAAHAKAAAASCSQCGVVESVRAVEVRGNASGVGAVAGGVAGALLGNTMGQGNGRTAMTLIGGGAGAYAGNEIEKNTHKSITWQTRVRLDDGSYRTVSSRTQPDVAAGDKVKLVNGQVIARNDEAPKQ